MPEVYSRLGFCPICQVNRYFKAEMNWYRDHLFCEGCGSVPRERALALVLERERPEWRSLKIHESSPVFRGISLKLKNEATHYLATQFFPDRPLGLVHLGFQNENLEAQSFQDDTFDLVITLDVMEHVNRPDYVLQEVNRTLKPGGLYIFTVPTYKGKIENERRALYKDDGTIDYIAPAEYHGNPVDNSGALVTFHYGHDLIEEIFNWAGMNAEVVRFHDHQHGIIGDFTEVYIVRKPQT
jgi:SAM-dependent methyltransferase